MDISKFRQFGKKIVCVATNYKAFAAEKGIPIPKSPVVFLKPTTSYIEQGETIKIPPGCNDFVHEIELGVVIGTTTKGVSEDNVLACIGGFALCLDMTASDLLGKARKDGHSWALAKGFDTACPVSKFIPKEKIPDTNNARLWLKINGQTKQDSYTSDMIFNVPQILSYLSQYFTLEPGDLILTGSPAGAGPVSRGEVIEAGLEVDDVNIMTIKFPVE